MVCLGNICRSPLAHGLLEHKNKERDLNWIVDSAGTSLWHKGEKPDSRSIEVAKNNGIDISDQSSRQIVKRDLDEFDLILAMDSSNYNDILSLASKDHHKDKVKLILNYSQPNQNRGVPDPYYHGGFQSVYDMIEDAIDAMIEFHLS